MNCTTTLTATWGPPPCVSTLARGFLGDASSPGMADRDAFQFEGAGGAVTLTLEPDRAAGYTGTFASLLLRQASGSILARDSGALPITLTVTLPGAGTYQVVVDESAPASGKNFRGHYRLRATATSGQAVVLEPARTVEP